MMATEAEIFRDVALEAIKSSWKWKMTWLVLVVVILLLLILSAIADYHKLAMLNDIQKKMGERQIATEDAMRWHKFMADTQHREVLKSCVKHHTDPPWENYPQIPVVPVMPK